MAKTTNATLEQMIAGIDERIGLLNTVKGALEYAFTGEYHQLEQQPEEPAARPVRRAKKHSKRTRMIGARGSNRELFMAILRDAGGPLSIDEVYARAKAKRWQTTSGEPRNLVAVTLRSISKQGQIRKVGRDWEYMPQEIVETAQAAV